MRPSSSPRVLAIGIDAAEPTLVRQWIARGELPELRALLESGGWGEVRSPAHIGSGAVWPTFMTGTGPEEHGVYSVLPWDPGTMALVRLTTDRLRPFWTDLARGGHSVAILDVPFAPVVGLPGGIEIAEWGAHDRVRGRMAVSPPGLQAWVARTAGTHPFGAGRAEVTGPDDGRGLRTLAAACQEGARLRGTLAVRLLAERHPDVLVAVFPEIHHASHYLWHTLEREEPAPLRAPNHAPESAGTDPGSPGLLEIYREVARQIGELARAAGDAAILVFSLHGMRATGGIPDILDPLLRRLGLAALPGLRAGSWAERRRQVISLAREIAPEPLRRLYRRARPVDRVPAQTIPLSYSWARTVAFPVPTDQHGWIRVNLRDRERKGTVAPADYDGLCARLERLLRGLATRAGQRVVADVLAPGCEGGRPPDLLPDLIVHWEDAATVNVLRLATPRLARRARGTQFTGQHAPAGFFIQRPRPGQTFTLGAAAGAEELYRFIRAALTN